MWTYQDHSHLDANKVGGAVGGGDGIDGGAVDQHRADRGGVGTKLGQMLHCQAGGSGGVGAQLLSQQGHDCLIPAV